MKPLGTVPIYFETQDKRILDYMNKNIVHHELIAGVPETKEGVSVRTCLFLFFLAVIIYTLLKLWGIV